MSQPSNPYSDLVSIMRDQGSAYNPPSIQLAKVVTPPPNLIISMGDLQLDGGNLLVADYLLSGYQREVILPVATPDSESISPAAVGDHGSHTHTVTTTAAAPTPGIMTFTDTLKAGDQLAVMPTSDKQTFLIIGRMVSI